MERMRAICRHLLVDRNSSAARWGVHVASVLLFALMAPLPAQAGPYVLATETRFYNETWFPLPRDQMERAAADPALARLSDSGLFRFVSQGQAAVEGTLTLEVSLVEAAEVAKIAIHMDVEGEGSFAATSSTSLRDLDHQGIFLAFAHIGKDAADGLMAKLTALEKARAQKSALQNQSESVARLERIAKQLESVVPQDEPTPKPGDVHWQSEYNRAQDLKRAGRFFEARVILETIVADALANDPIHGMARDELRFGLPMFEASYWSQKVFEYQANAEPNEVFDLWNRSEQRLRQVLAENADRPERMAKAQAELDRLTLSRNALRNALRVNALSQLMPLKMALTEHVAIKGTFPAREEAEAMLRDYHLDARFGTYDVSDTALDAELTTSSGERFTVTGRPIGHRLNINIKAR